MNGKEILVDTNILLYLLQGDDTIAQWLQGRTVLISFITELELLGFPKITTQEELRIKALLEDCDIIPFNHSIKEIYVFIRRKYALKLADCLIAATASYMEVPLMTADKQISKLQESEVILYKK